MNQFQTELPTMQVAAGHVFDVNTQIQATLRDLLNRLEPLMSTWQGSASVSFHTLKERWNDNAVKLNDALMGIAENLQQTHTNYDATETANDTGFKNITGNLA